MNSNRTGFVVADGFTPSQSGNVNSVCWWGAYLNNSNQNCEASSTDTFRIRYFDDAGGLPGTEIASFSQQASTLTLEPPYSTGLLLAGVAPEYEFHAVHPDLPLTGGNCYWIEISNQLTNCTWFWELGLSGDGRAAQDGDTGPPSVPPNGYENSDVTVADLAFCTNLSLQQGENCLPPPPPNDNCPDASPISGEGTFAVDTAAATCVGPNHPSCLSTGQTGIDRDAWFRWTSTCSGDVLARTCNTTTVDTKIAVYSGTTCPSSANDPVACNDDLCGNNGLQSMLVFPANVNQQFLIRVGSYPGEPGGVIGLVISCGPPDNQACGAGSGNASCCSGSVNDSSGCGDEACCELVCACDPFCCNVEWDSDCAADGLGDSGCGAGALCNCGGVCGDPSSGSCCSAHSTPGCSDTACCQAICSCDPYCCDTEWDASCAGNGFVPGCGAAVLCPNVCGSPCGPGNPCPDDGLECTRDICANGVCQHPPAVLGTPCGNQTPQGPCDRPNVCNGNGACSANFEPAATVCRMALNECDVAEHCSGSSASCPANGFAANGSPCTSDNVECTTDACLNGQCAHQLKPSGAACGNSVPQGPCDLPDACGGGLECESKLKGATEVCRVATNECDVNEYCSGTSADCPTNDFAGAGTACDDDGNRCTDDRCDGLGQCAHSNSQLCGACCGGPAGCANGMLAEDCPDGFHLGEDCAELKCNGIPTVSEWGVLLIALSLLVAAKIVFSRSMRPRPE